MKAILRLCIAFLAGYLLAVSSVRIQHQINISSGETRTEFRLFPFHFTSTCDYSICRLFYSSELQNSVWCTLGEQRFLKFSPINACTTTHAESLYRGIELLNRAALNRLESEEWIHQWRSNYWGKVASGGDALSYASELYYVGSQSDYGEYP